MVVQKIIPYLWFDSNAEEAAQFYVSAFNNSKIVDVARYGQAGAEVSGRPEGTVMTVAFELEGERFVALNGGPVFKFSPAVSFFVNCKTEQEIDGLWKKLSAEGTALMKLDRYPFSEKFGWIEDKFGVSWQLNLSDGIQKIVPFLTFVGKQHGKAEEAIKLYTSLFEDSEIIYMERYGADEEQPEGRVKHASFSLAGQQFMAMESNLDHPFTFTPAISFLVDCETQPEIDDLWNRLSEGGETEQCGWLKDKYGVSWQIVPAILEEMLQDKDARRTERVFKAMLQMNKLDINGLKKAYQEKV